MNRYFFAALIAGSLLAVNVAASDDDAGAMGANANLGGMRLLPEDSPWHQDISANVVDPNSEKILARIGLDKPLRADFGAGMGRRAHGHPICRRSQGPAQGAGDIHLRR